MNLTSLPKPSERQQIVLILMAAIGLIFGAWTFSSKMLGRNQKKIDDLRTKIEKSGHGNKSINDLERELAHEKELLKQTRAQWLQLSERLGTYANQRALRQTSAMHIDYKVELIRQRDRLIQKSEALGVELLPDYLEMELELTESEEARERMLQLKAVERLADLTLDGRIERLYSISPLKPGSLKEDGRSFLEVYPVKVEFDVAFNNFFGLMQTIFEDDSIFAFDNIRIIAGQEKDAPLRVFAVMKALIFYPPKES